MIPRPIIACLLLGTFLAPGYSRAESNVHSVNKFSWSENCGWMNWRDADGGAAGVTVTETFLSGYVWLENAGWLNVGPGAGPYGNTTGEDFGVNVLPGGDLDGFGWAENIGWVNFGWAEPADENRPRFDLVEGRFRGWAWSENAGWVNLDHAEHFVAVECTYDDACDDGDVCTCDQCIVFACSNTDRDYGDANCDDVVNVFDILCMLDVVAGQPADCSFVNADLAPCEPDGVVNVFDMFAVLNAIAGTDPCCSP